MAGPINKSLKYAVVADFLQNNILKRSFKLLFCKLMQRPLWVTNIKKDALDSAFYVLLEAVLTIPKFTAEWNVVAIGQELVYKRTRTWKAIEFVKSL